MSEVQDSDVQIRQVEGDEIASLWNLSESLGLAKDTDYFDRCLELQAKGKRQVFIAGYQGQDVGYCILNWEPKYGLFKKLGIAEIQDLNVVKEQREKGIATTLIAYCEDLARKRGHQEIGISVGVHENFGPAQKLYCKLGYRPDGAGVTYDRKPVSFAAARPIDDNLCLMLLKDLQN